MSFKQTPVQLIKEKIKELNFFPKKFLGQNFLINPKVIEKTISAVEDLNPTLIMEIGPGLGALTDQLILLNRPFFVVEIDSRLCRYWRQKEICVLEGDILKLSWQSQLHPGSILVGNLPYQIASRLMVECCPGSDKIKAMVLMFQKEVAQRILATPSSKDYGLLSVLSQCFWKASVLMEASVSDFHPRPKVAGQVLVFCKKRHSIKDPVMFLTFVKLCFSQRRKFLLSQLKKIKQKDRIVDFFNKMSLSSSVRAEELYPEQFVSLFNGIVDKKQS